MAYMNQEKKAKIAEALKKVVPKEWKYSLAVRNHSTIVFTLRSAPHDILGHVQRVRDKFSNEPKTYQRLPEITYTRINEKYLDHQFEGLLLRVFSQIADALNLNNHDNSDPMTDYFDVGHYVDLSIGQWDKPFTNTSKETPC